MKTRVRTSAHKVRSELAARAEVMYLELNRGRRGVPRLYGGWRDAREDRVYYVVQRAGSPIVVDEVSNNSSAAWLAFCRADPVGAATALVECFRSFTSSGYFMEDLHGAQFTLAGNDIYAIDAPETLPDAPVAAVCVEIKILRRVRPPCHLHDIDGGRVQETRSWMVFRSIFGPRRGRVPRVLVKV